MSSDLDTWSFLFGEDGHGSSQTFDSLRGLPVTAAAEVTAAATTMSIDHSLPSLYCCAEGGSWACCSRAGLPEVASN